MTPGRGCRFYTYMHRRRDTGAVFYIGKGAGRRAWSKSNRNKHWRHVTERHGYTVEILAPWPLEAHAFEHEKHLIACGRMLGWPLVNATDGGDGPSGWTPSLETRDRISAAHKGRKMAPETKAKISAAHKGRTFSPEHIEKLRAVLLARNATPEQRAASSKKKGRSPSADTRSRMSAAATGKKRGPFSAEHRANLSAAMLGRVNSEETRRKMAEAKRGRAQPRATVEARSLSMKRIYADLAGRQQPAEAWASELGITITAFRHRVSRGQFVNTGVSARGRKTHKEPA